MPSELLPEAVGPRMMMSCGCTATIPFCMIGFSRFHIQHKPTFQYLHFIIDWRDPTGISSLGCKRSGSLLFHQIFDAQADNEGDKDTHEDTNRSVPADEDIK